MNIEEIRDYCLDKPGITEGFPFSKLIRFNTQFIWVSSPGTNINIIYFDSAKNSRIPVFIY